MKNKKTFLSTSDEQLINYVQWIPEHPTPPKAILQIVHGMAEYIERYEEFANYLNQHNILIVGHDHLGHGESVTKEAPIHGYFSKGDSLAHLIGDVYTVTELTKQDYPNIPYYIMGHSMGSFITRNYLKKYSDNVDGAIIMGTGGKELGTYFIRPVTALLNIIVPKKTNKLIDTLAFGSFGKNFPENDTPMCWLSLNQQNVESYHQDPLLGFTFTNNGFHTLFRLSAQANKNNWYKNIRKDLPILLISGQDDPVGQYGNGPTGIAADLTKKKFDHVNLILYPQLRHEILNEDNRRMVMRDITNWLKQHL